MVANLVARPILLDPVTLGWRQLEDGHYIPVISKFPAAPEAVVELVKCSCVISKCRGWPANAVHGAVVRHII